MKCYSFETQLGPFDDSISVVFYDYFHHIFFVVKVHKMYVCKIYFYDSFTKNV